MRDLWMLKPLEDGRFYVMLNSGTPGGEAGLGPTVPLPRTYHRPLWNDYCLYSRYYHEEILFLA